MIVSTRIVAGGIGGVFAASAQRSVIVVDLPHDHVIVDAERPEIMFSIWIVVRLEPIECPHGAYDLPDIVVRQRCDAAGQYDFAAEQRASKAIIQGGNALVRIELS